MTDAILNQIRFERERQDALAEDGRWSGDRIATINDQHRLVVLVEEVGEVARAVQGEGELREELVQVAAVAVAWLEALE